jgi:hypothetical protein
LLATFQLKKDIKPQPLADSEYDELSDSEELENDAMPPRYVGRYSTAHFTQTLNFHGKAQFRYEWCSTLFNNDRNYSAVTLT